MPAEYRTIGLVRRYHPAQEHGNKILKKLEGLLSSEDYGQDLAGVDSALSSLTLAMAGSARFQVMHVPEQPPGSGSSYFPDPLAPAEVQRLCSLYGPDALVALEVFDSDTDTETIAHLVHYHLGAEGDLLGAVQRTVAELEGAYSLGVVRRSEPDRVVGARLGSPLVVGIGVGEHFLASDVAALQLDAADRPAFAQGQPQLHFGVVEEGVRPGVQVLAALEHQRRHPLRVVAVEAPRHADEAVQIGLALDGRDVGRRAARRTKPDRRRLVRQRAGLRKRHVLP